MPAIGWTTFRLPEEEIKKVKTLAEKHELSFARMMLEIVRIGLKHVKDLTMAPKVPAKK